MSGSITRSQSSGSAEDRAREGMEITPDEHTEQNVNDKHKNPKAKWTVDEDSILLHGRKEGAERPFAEISSQVGRTTQACRLRDLNLRRNPRLLVHHPLELVKLARRPSVHSRAHREMKKHWRGNLEKNRKRSIETANRSTEEAVACFRAIRPIPSTAPSHGVASFGSLTMTPPGPPSQHASSSEDDLESPKGTRRARRISVAELLNE